MKEAYYKLSIDVALTLKTDIAKDNLLKVINALKYGERKKVGEYYIIDDYKGVRYAIDFAANEIFCYVKPYLTVVFTSKGGIDLMANRAIRWDFLDHTEAAINSRDALEIEITKKIVNIILALATEEKRSM